jgi:hypothetical protein
MGGELALPDFGIRVIGKDHRSDPISDNSRLFQLLVISPNMI